jgi:hypothetical protein
MQSFFAVGVDDPSAAWFGCVVASHDLLAKKDTDDGNLGYHRKGGGLGELFGQRQRAGTWLGGT